MASSGTFSGKVVPAGISCGAGGWADHLIRGSWYKGATTTTFTASLYKANGGAGFQYSCSRGLCFKVLGGSGEVVGQACFQTGSTNGATFTFANGSRMNLYAGSLSCCNFGGGCPAVATTMNGTSQQNTITLTIPYSGNFTLQTCWDGWCGGGQNRGCKTIDYGGTGYIDPYIRTPIGPKAWVSDIDCSSAVAHCSVNDRGIPINTFKQRFEWSENADFSNPQVTQYVDSQTGTWNLSGLKPATKYYFKSYSYTVNDGNIYGVNSDVLSFTTKGSIKTSNIKFNAINPSPFRVIFSISDIEWDPDNCGSTIKKASLNWKYTMDGVDYSFNKVFDAGADFYEYDTGVDIDKIPDDETITYTWTLTNSFNSIVLQKTLYCQNSYDAFVINKDTNYLPVEATLRVSPAPGQKPTKDVRSVFKIS